MQTLFCTLFLMALFFVLIPGVLVSIPSKGTPKMRAFVHTVIFGVIVYLTTVMYHKSSKAY